MNRKWDAADLALRLENHKEYTPAANEIVMEDAAGFIKMQHDLIKMQHDQILGLEAMVRTLENESPLKPWPDPFAKNSSKPKGIYDFELCAEYEELKSSLHSINHLGYALICATQDHRGVYTLFFRRPPE